MTLDLTSALWHNMVDEGYEVSAQLGEAMTGKDDQIYRTLEELRGALYPGTVFLPRIEDEVESARRSGREVAAELLAALKGSGVGGRSRTRTHR